MIQEGLTITTTNYSLRPPNMPKSLPRLTKQKIYIFDFDFEEKTATKRSFKNHENERLNLNFDEPRSNFISLGPLSTSNDPKRNTLIRFEMARTSDHYCHLI